MTSFCNFQPNFERPGNAGLVSRCWVVALEAYLEWYNPYGAKRVHTTFGHELDGHWYFGLGCACATESPSRLATINQRIAFVQIDFIFPSCDLSVIYPPESFLKLHVHVSVMVKPPLTSVFLYSSPKLIQTAEHL
jgi:hypothetical protein